MSGFRITALLHALVTPRNESLRIIPRGRELLSDGGTVIRSAPCSRYLRRAPPSVGGSQSYPDSYDSLVDQIKRRRLPSIALRDRKGCPSLFVQVDQEHQFIEVPGPALTQVMAYLQGVC